MANYIIKWSDPSLKSSISLLNGQIDETSTSLVLYGKKSPSWGEKNQENLLRLLENFASNLEPSRPTIGQLWFDSESNMLKVWWRNKWNLIGLRRIDSDTQPVGHFYPGTFWFNTKNNTLYVCNNVGNWKVVYDQSSSTPVPAPTVVPTPTTVPTTAPTPTPTAAPTGAPTTPLVVSDPVVVTQDGQVIENLYIIATGGTAAILNNGFDNVVVRYCYITHDKGTGIDVRNAANMRIENSVIDCVGASDKGTNQSASMVNVQVQRSPLFTVIDSELFDGAAGVVMKDCERPHLRNINGFNFRGPSPRGEFVYMEHCTDAVVEDFYNLNTLDVAWNDDSIVMYNCNNPIVRRGCIDGSNGDGFGVKIYFDDGLSTGGMIENVDAVHMGKGAFAAIPGQNVTFRFCRVKDNHTSAVGGRDAPTMNGYVFHGYDGNLDPLTGGNAHNIATNLQMDTCTVWNLANPNNVVYDEQKFARVEYVTADFTPQGRVPISKLPTLGGTPTTNAPTQAPTTNAPTQAPTPSPTTSPTPVPTQAADPLPFGINFSVGPMTFREEFSGSSLDTTLWKLQFPWENPTTNNYSVRDGSLHIWPDNSGGQFFNRTIHTDGRFWQKYGYFEIEATLPRGRGCWPAFWLYNIDDDTGAIRPEIDIMEAYPGGGPDGWWGNSNLEPTNFASTVWYPDVTLAGTVKLSDTLANYDPETGPNLYTTAHRYACLWDSTGIQFYFDGQPLGSKITTTQHNSRMFLLLDLYFGSASGDPDSTTPTGITNSFKINYVRTWALSNGATEVEGSYRYNGTAPSPTQAPTTQAPISTQAPAPTSQPTPFGQDANLYTSLTFQDEFNGSTLDAGKWTTHSWYMPQNDRNNYRVVDGMLKIWAEAPFEKENRTITTDGKFEQRYGFFEMEARLCRGPAVWPAFWLYAHPGDDRPEIDIMEAYPGGAVGWWQDGNTNPMNYGITLHKANADYSWHEVPYAYTMRDFSQWSGGMRLDTDFHKYGCHWDATGIQFYFDGQPIGPKYNDNDGYFSKPMYLLVDVWLGSESGDPNVTPPITGEGNSFEIKYVRAWQLK